MKTLTKKINEIIRKQREFGNGTPSPGLSGKFLMIGNYTVLPAA